MSVFSFGIIFSPSEGCLFTLFIVSFLSAFWASLVAQLIKNPPAMQETLVWFLGWEDPLEKDRLPTPVFLPGKSPGTKEPGGLQSLGSQRVGHD